LGTVRIIGTEPTRSNTVLHLRCDGMHEDPRNTRESKAAGSNQIQTRRAPRAASPPALCACTVASRAGGIGFVTAGAEQWQQCWPLVAGRPCRSQCAVASRVPSGLTCGAGHAADRRLVFAGPRLGVIWAKGVGRRAQHGPLESSLPRHVLGSPRTRSPVHLSRLQPEKSEPPTNYSRASTA
jgi:hypothetical protein